ncbi:unnamed protein product [Rotaria socialis]|uniref:G-protein coupled receptors family 1 profile domain-containing protein n=1 Tax=Rotaria socialis TaxID=392032 RepID=A0A818NMS0_9BILA|nr:unnamed protein product [Rotaria socialis]CAF3427720.1 unnamed protein product [Rotaria socialis]CAF3609803.1 unnamed protein product [Rotaria socialis]CAF3700504.1 unnamed protein product [Rotaria socialis]CAF3700519.1 unnamed protein product [Rotaria socialis]
MTTLINISLITYFTLVSVIGTLGNGVILLAYGNRWNSSKSTSVIFILILACVDLWTCLIVVPAIAIMEYRDFDVPTAICRFYSFSKNLIIISSFIMSFIALDRFLNIAVPHYRLLNPRRVKVILTLFISIGIGLGTLTALAFSTQPVKKNYYTNFNLILGNESNIALYNEEISLNPDQNLDLIADIINLVTEQLSIPDGANITNLTLEYRSMSKRCFADTSIISEILRDLLKHVSNKVFFTLIGIVTIFYTITFVLALHRQNPRIRALKKSLNVLIKFDSYPSAISNQRTTDSIVPVQPLLTSSVTTRITNLSPRIRTNVLNEFDHSDDNLLSQQTLINSSTKVEETKYEMSNFINRHDNEDPNHFSPILIRKPTKINRKTQEEHDTSTSDGISEELHPSPEKTIGSKQVSFQIENSPTTLNRELNQNLSTAPNYFDNELDVNTDMYYKLPCPCSTTRQLLIKFHFSRSSSQLRKWLCRCCCTKKQLSLTQHESIEIHGHDEIAKGSISTTPTNRTGLSHSDALRRQLHQHRIKQIRMASTFLIITVSFVLFYLPSILNAERIIKSPIMIYYLYLCTHALNPIIYCFMNPSLRAYVISMFNCRKRREKRNIGKGKTSIFER